MYFLVVVPVQCANVSQVATLNVWVFYECFSLHALPHVVGDGFGCKAFVCAAKGFDGFFAHCGSCLPLSEWGGVDACGSGLSQALFEFEYAAHAFVYALFGDDSSVDGIDYEYNTGLDGAEPLTVHINVERNFFVVRFFTNGKKQTLLSEQIVDRGATATAPEITDTPQCKTFVAWSDSFSDIQADKDVWATWKDDHIYKVTGFHDNTVDMSCVNGCGTTQSYSFFDVVGAERGDDVYNSALDLNADGIINGRDQKKKKKGLY